MSGTNTICVVTVLIETGMVKAIEPVTHLKLETPAGLIAVDAEVHHGKVRKVTFRNVPAFATHLDAKVEVRGLGTVTVDVAYGGMFYVIADAAPLGLTLAADEAREIVKVAEMIKAATQEQLPVTHPENAGISGVTIAQLSGPPSTPRRAPQEYGRGVDRRRSIGRGRNRGPARSTVRPAAPAPAPRWPPCTPRGNSGCTRISSTRASWAPHLPAACSKRRASGPYAAVVPSLSGQAWITGFAQYVLDPEDPFPNGFTVGDIWGKA